MADYIQVTGKVDVMFQPNGDVGQADSLVKVGEQMDMSDIEVRSFYHNVPGDRHGGPEGPPIETQYLGSIAIIRCDLSRWDPTVVDVIRKLAVNTTLGTVAAAEVGTLMLRDAGFRILLLATNRSINFPCCIVREPYQYGMGTKFTRYALQFEAHRKPEAPKQGVLFDSDTAE